MIEPRIDVLESTYFIKHGDDLGTGFVVQYEGKKYLITAKHLFQKLNASTSIVEIFKNGRFVHLNVNAYYHTNNDVDVVVLTGEEISKMNAMTLQSGNFSISMGQEVYFLGFPFGINTEKSMSDSGYPIPFAKHAYLSNVQTKDGYVHYWLDGINNPGFSGAPVLFRNRPSQDDSKPHYLLGVVCSYRYDMKPIYDKTTQRETNYVYKENAGLINVHGMKCITEIIEQNNI